MVKRKCLSAFIIADHACTLANIAIYRTFVGVQCFKDSFRGNDALVMVVQYEIKH